MRKQPKSFYSELTIKYRGKVLLGDVVEEVEEIVDEEKDKSFKTGYITLYTKRFHAHRHRT